MRYLIAAAPVLLAAFALMIFPPWSLAATREVLAFLVGVSGTLVVIGFPGTCRWLADMERDYQSMRRFMGIRRSR